MATPVEDEPEVAEFTRDLLARGDALLAASRVLIHRLDSLLAESVAETDTDDGPPPA